MTNILIIEDDILINNGIKEILLDKNYQVFQAFNKQDTLDILSDDIDLVLLDLNLPDCDGFDVCQLIKSTHDIAIVVITAREKEKDMIKGFDLGADDYVVKPFSINVLVKRIEAVLKRYQNENSSRYIAGDLSYDLNSMILKIGGAEVPLSATENKILKVFIENRKRILTRNQIINLVWDIDGGFIDENTLNVNISRLRKKIETNNEKTKFIKTVFGIGYRWRCDLE